jgi:hypothetical protein
LQILNDQNRKTSKWLSDQVNLEKDAKQLKTTQAANTVLSEERIKQIDNLRSIHEQDTDQIQRLNVIVSDANRQYQNLLQKQNNNQVQIKELKKHFSTRDNVIDDVFRIQNSANAPKIPSTNSTPLPTAIDLTTTDHLHTGVKERISQIESASEPQPTPTQIPPPSASQTEISATEDEEVFQDSNGHSQEVETMIKEYLQTIDKSEAHVSEAN